MRLLEAIICWLVTVLLASFIIGFCFVVGDGDFKHLGGAFGMLGAVSGITSAPLMILIFWVNHRAYSNGWDRIKTIKFVLGTQVICGLVCAIFSMGLALVYMLVGLAIWYWRFNVNAKKVFLQ